VLGTGRSFKLPARSQIFTLAATTDDQTERQHKQENMDNSTSIKEAIWNQLGASIDMLENAINMCPDEHWDTTLNFWYTSYHCIFWTDYYLTTEPSKFEPPTPFTFSEFDPTGKKPDRTYNKTEVLTYFRTLPTKSKSTYIWFDS
jgi:hypothetical protein